MVSYVLFPLVYVKGELLSSHNLGISVLGSLDRCARILNNRRKHTLRFRSSVPHAS